MKSGFSTPVVSIADQSCIHVPLVWRSRGSPLKITIKFCYVKSVGDKGDDTALLSEHVSILYLLWAQEVYTDFPIPFTMILIYWNNTFCASRSVQKLIINNIIIGQNHNNNNYIIAILWNHGILENNKSVTITKMRFVNLINRVYTLYVLQFLIPMNMNHNFTNSNILLQWSIEIAKCVQSWCSGCVCCRWCNGEINGDTSVVNWLGFYKPFLRVCGWSQIGLFLVNAIFGKRSPVSVREEIWGKNNNILNNTKI